MFSTYQYKLRTHNVGRHKGRTVQTSDVQSLDWDKHQTSTNVRPLQTSDQYKRQTSINVRPVQTSDHCKRRTGIFLRKNVVVWLSFKK